jgi:polyhydroxybutyrate depolymerase
MMTRKRIVVFLLLAPLICIACLGLILVLMYLRNQLRWGDDLTEIAEASQPGDYEVSLEHDGRNRNYRLHLPPAYDGSRDLPLVIVLHGASGNADIFAQVTGFATKADAEGFIVAHPNGSGRLPNHLLTWNAGGCCGYAVRSGSDDVGFLRALIESLSAELTVDSQRIYITGMSNGGMMSLAAACELDDLIAGAGSVVGVVTWASCAPDSPVNLIMINGDADRIVPSEGGMPFWKTNR